MKWMLPVAWVLWAALNLLLVYGLFKVATERAQSPEATRGLGVGVMLLLILLSAGAGYALRWAASRQSVGAVAVLAVLFAYPLVSIAASKWILTAKERRYANEFAAIGDSPDPRFKLLAALVISGDSAGLKNALAGQPAPTGKDLAGYDLLALAAMRIRDNQASPDCLRVLLESGLVPGASRMPDGLPILHALVRDAPSVRILLAHGADPNVPDPASGWPPLANAGESPDSVRALIEAGANPETLIDGIPAVVRFTMTRCWESATYLVEKGVRLDTSDNRGLSLDYYLKDWKDGVFGEHPEGWDRLRDAIAKRRASPTP